MAGSTAVAVFLDRDSVGELVASVGIEFQAASAAELPEGGRYEKRSDDATAFAAHVAFSILGRDLPLGVSRMQLVPIFHHGLDLGEVLRRIPDHADH